VSAGGRDAPLGDGAVGVLARLAAPGVGVGPVGEARVAPPRGVGLHASQARATEPRGVDEVGRRTRRDISSGFW
jgi:hypothetical protein